MKVSALLLLFCPSVTAGSLRERKTQDCNLTCGDFATCAISSNGLVQCVCVDGAAIFGTDGCLNIDECASFSPCPVNTICTDMDPPDRYQCECTGDLIGLNFNDFGPTSCTNVCPIDCPGVGSCEGTASGVICSCPDGARLNDEGVCEDINECVEDNACSFPGGYCVDHNPPTKYVCDCNPWIGYARASPFGPQGVTSCDLNECLLPDENNCSEFATCSNTMGSFECTCNDGYTGDGTVCAPIETTPAPTPLSPCDDKTCDPIQQVCAINAEGNAFCNCTKYWIAPSGVGGACTTDVDECRPGVQSCPDNAECVNIPGRFFCYCSPGFTENQGECVPITPSPTRAPVTPSPVAPTV